MYKPIIVGLILWIKIIIVQSRANYDVILENVDYSSNSNDYINWNFEVVVFNKTINVLNGKLIILKDITIDTQMHIVGSEKRGSNYFPTLIDVTMNICEFLKEKHVVSIFLPRTDFPKDCIITAGDYTLKDMIVLNDDLPEKITGRYWKMDFEMITENNTIAELSLFARIDRLRNNKIG